MGYLKTATAVIDLQAMKHNLQVIRQYAPDSKLMAIIKANGYGHGLLKVAQNAEGADALGVARIEEAIKLREGGITKPILQLEGFNGAEELPSLVQYDIQVAVHCTEQIEALESAELSAPVEVWVKVDTGMHRLGVRPEELTEFVDRLTQCKNVAQPLRFMSHFGQADERDNSITKQQTELFANLTQNYPAERSIAASAGILAWPESHLEWNRCGIIMYGVSPFVEDEAACYDCRPVMTLKSSLIAVREVKAGESVGYGAIWTSERDTKVGVVAIGYGDGYPRTAPNGTPVWVNDRKVPLSGRVSMDMLTVDLGPGAQDEVGDEVVLWGQELPVEEVARHAGTIAYELVTRLTQRVEMEYID